MSARDAEAAALLDQLRAIPAVTADVEHVDDAGPCGNDYWHDTRVWIGLVHRGEWIEFCADCGLRFVGDTPACDPLDVYVLVPVKIRESAR